jgi:hypothetical protein
MSGFSTVQPWPERFLADATWRSSVGKRIACCVYRQRDIASSRQTTGDTTT